MTLSALTVTPVTFAEASPVTSLRTMAPAIARESDVSKLTLIGTIWVACSGFQKRRSV